MLFNSALYGVFLALAYFIYWLLRKREGGRVLFLVVASYVFYSYGTFDAARDAESASPGTAPLGPLPWAALCLGIIFVGSSLDYGLGIWIGRTEDPRKRRALLLVSITYYLGVLAFFKYFNFAVDTWVDALRLLGIHVEPVHVRVALPFGISFFTFETMSYTIDVYRREIVPCRRYTDYLCFVAFFPHLVAGPIVRPRAMLPQFRAPLRFRDDEQLRGLFLIGQGLLKKIVIGDTLAVNLVSRAFASPERYSSLEMLVAVYGYAFQIYADFSGYTDVALGSAKLFGLELPKNFDRPYLSTNLQDFWRRWHISLSTWLRDYLYVPLGGSRGAPWKTYRNLFLTMLLGGLWHGASWNFVLWGALHGTGLAVVRVYQRAGGAPWPRVLSTFFTFQFVCVAWVFFRAPTFDHARLVFVRLAEGTTGAANLAPRVLVTLAGAAVLHLTSRRALDRVRDWVVMRPAAVQGAVLAAIFYVLHLAAAAKPEPFVYGQF